ncbi:MAG: type II toxin-antitoxin system RelE/ParE family toxin [bacterium]|nr:type II toxin-antitoxin system RelE/ParE family toxin [bacterium]
MVEYQIRFTTSAANEFRRLPDHIKDEAELVIEGLKKNPRPFGVRKLKGHNRLYRIRIGQYRLVYEIDDKTKLVRVTRVRHRREVYR